MVFDEHDLTFVAPHRRAEVKRRIRVVEGYIAAPGVAAAQAAADQLGMSVSSLHTLVRAWRRTGKPEDLIGSGRPRTRRTEFADEQREIIAAAAAELPDNRIQRVIERANEIAAKRGVKMPSWNAMRKRVKEELGPRLPPNSFAGGADIIVDHVAVDMPVLFNDGNVAMPVAAIVVHVANAAVLGAYISKETPSFGAVAFALKEAFEAGIPAAKDGGEPVLAMQAFPGDGWRRLVGVAAELPIRLQVEQRAQLGRANLAASLLGERHEVLWLKPRLTASPPDKRPATLLAGAKPLTLEEANRFLGERWVVAAPSGRLQLDAKTAMALRRVHLVPLDRTVGPEALD